MPATVVSLGGVTFDIDPEQLTPMFAVRRGSVHRIIDDGSGNPGTVYQDLGIEPSDHVIELSGFFTEEATAKSIFALYRLKGAQHTFIDYKGNQFTVIFTPGVASFHCEPVRGADSAWRYSMSLSVVTVTTWFSSSYPPDE